MAEKKPVLAATLWPTNAAIIKALATDLPYMRKGLVTLDPTYGEGNWWSDWRPTKLVTHDLKLDRIDFRNLPYKDNTFPQIAYDPPYVSPGGRESSNIKEMYDAYGLMGAPTSPRKLQALINEGLAEMYRVCRPARRMASGGLSGGIVLVKVMNYISSGQLWPGISRTLWFAEELGFELEEQLFHVRKSGGPQPKNRTKRLPNGNVVKSTQQHARNNVSCMLVLRKK